MAAADPSIFSHMGLVAPMGIKPVTGEIMDFFAATVQRHLMATVTDPANTRCGMADGLVRLSGIPLPVLTLVKADASRRTISPRISTLSRGGFTPVLWAARSKELEMKTCPFKNLPEARRGQWGEGLTAAGDA
jgi:hypothetical protein